MVNTSHFVIITVPYNINLVQGKVCIVIKYFIVLHINISIGISNNVTVVTFSLKVRSGIREKYE